MADGIVSLANLQEGFIKVVTRRVNYLLKDGCEVKNQYGRNPNMLPDAYN